MEAVSPLADHLHDILEAAVVRSLRSLCDLQLVRVSTATIAEPMVTGMVCLTGELKGVLMLTCSEATGESCANTMLGQAPGPPELRDAVGELANVVGGIIVTRLHALGTRVDISLPVVAYGPAMMVLAHDRAGAAVAIQALYGTAHSHFFSAYLTCKIADKLEE